VKVRISASILDCDFTRLGQELNAVLDAGVDAIHLDIMDGHFVPNLSFGTPIVQAVRRTVSLPIYTHLMVIEPEKMIPRFVSHSDYLIFHIEATSQPENCIAAIRNSGRLPGISLNPDTPVERIIPLLSHLEDVLLMSVFPGFGGQQFIPESLNRITHLAELRRESGLSYTISVDGGVTPANAHDIVRAGADILVAGSAIFRSSSYRETVRALRCLNS